MHRPEISICLPNLNNRRFLQKRLESIYAQSFGDWELVVVDGSFDDGLWALLSEHAAREPRMRISQAPREGIYRGINECIGLARGEFVYIATSDDTMAADCLEKLGAALKAYPQCDLAHCPLRVEGLEEGRAHSWWRRGSLFARSSRDLLDRLHIRHAPLDGLLHLYGETVYLSLTQLLIRRTLFDRIGFFESRWGSISDFNWGMRASLVANTVHVPDTWGGWRVHPGQATHTVVVRSAEQRQSIEEMIDDALQRTWSDLPSSVRDGLQGGWRDAFGPAWVFEQEFNRHGSRTARVGYLLSQVAISSAARSYVVRRLKGAIESPGEVVDGWLRSHGLERCLKPA